MKSIFKTKSFIFILNFSKRPANRSKENAHGSFSFGVQCLHTFSSTSLVNKVNKNFLTSLTPSSSAIIFLELNSHMGEDFRDGINVDRANITVFKDNKC
jgi:hypothetical protein